MRRTIREGLLLAAAASASLLLLGATSSPPAKPAPVGTCKDDAGWDDPAEPFHIYGNTWYVGTCGVSSILVTSPSGDVLIDGDSANGPPLIEASIRRLGFRIRDVRYIVNSHAHDDHAGGLAGLQRDTGAQIVARGADADAIERGHGARSDPQFLIDKTFPRVAHVRRVKDGETLRLGGLAVTAHATPGHTPGSTSWTWRSCEKGRCVNVAYVDSLSAGSDKVYRYGDDAAHPGDLARFRASIQMVAGLPCDLLLTPHPSVSDMWLRFGPKARAPLIDPAACRRLAAHARTALDARVAKEKAGKAP